MMTAANQDPARYSVAVIASALRSGCRVMVLCWNAWRSTRRLPHRQRRWHENVHLASISATLMTGPCLEVSWQTVKVVQTAIELGGAWRLCLGVLTGGGGEEEADPPNDGQGNDQEGHQDHRLLRPSALCSWASNLVKGHGRSLQHMMFQPWLKCYSRDQRATGTARARPSRS